LCALPGEDILGGELVRWADGYWLVTERDPHDEVYTKASMEQCNYLLRWIDAYGRTVEKRCIVSDGTRYLAGETVGANVGNGLVLGDSRITVVFARDDDTVALNRRNRFLIDDYDSGTVLAYRITKPFKLGGVYNGRGCMSFIMSEVNTEDDDNFTLHIADYYKYFPRPDVPGGSGSGGGGGGGSWL
jgi:hypothetical protein